MRITCPSCQATYDVEARLLANGRVVRCARCAHDWTPLADEPRPPPALALDPVAIDVPVAPVPPSPPPAPPPATSPATKIEPVTPTAELIGDARTARDKRGSSSIVWVGWAASLLLLAALAGAGYVYRDQIMQAWPPSIRLYAALGLRV